MKSKPTAPKKRKPATVAEMLASARRGVPRSPKSKRPKTVKTEKVRVIAEPSDDSDSEDYRPLNTIPLRLPVEVAARDEAIAADQGKSGATTHEKRAAAKVRSTKTKRAKENQKRPALFQENASRTVATKREIWRRRATVREPEKERGDANLGTEGER